MALDKAKKKGKVQWSALGAVLMFLAITIITLYIRIQPEMQGRTIQGKVTVAVSLLVNLAIRGSSLGSTLCNLTSVLLLGRSCTGKQLRFHRATSNFRFGISTLAQQTKGGPNCCSILAMGLLDDCSLRVSGKTWNQLNEPIRRRWNQTEWFRKPVTDGAAKAYNSVPRADLFLTALGTALTVLAIRRSLKRYRTAQEIPLDFFRRKRKLNGYVVSVNDSDNIRFYHCSPISRFFLRKPSVKRSDLKYETMNVRLAGIDAPEMAHFGGDCQPYAKEAKEWLTKFVEGRRVTIQLLRYDQYSRAVASVHVGWLIKKNVSVEMVKAGFATIYEEGGAEYGTFEPELRKHLKEAQTKRKGMWKQSWLTYVSPAQYKKNLKEAVANAATLPPPAVAADKWKPSNWAFWK